MLGLADRGRVLDLFDSILRGDAAGALTELAGQYSDGADPLAVLRDLAEITHWVSVIKITPQAVEDPTIGPDERSRGLTMAAALQMRTLTRMWQMLLKSLEEVALAPNAMMAAEMAVIRLTHVSDLPTPEDLIRRLQSTPAPQAQAPSPPSSPPSSGPRMSAPSRITTSGNAALAVAQDALQAYPTFERVVDLIRAHRDMKLLVEVETTLRLARYSPGRIEFQPTANAPRDLAARLSQRLQSWTGQRWAVTLVNEGGAETISETADQTRAVLEAEATQMPLVQAILSAFPGAKISAIRTPDAIIAEAAVTALPEVEDEWDPFEDA